MKQTNFLATALFFFATLSLCSISTKGQGLNPMAAEVTKSHCIKSVFNNKTYQLRVSLPAQYSEQDTIHYPVLFVLDGKFSFDMMSSIRDVLDLGKEIKDVIIVTIDDSSTTEAEWMASRYNDFTPSSIPQADTLWSKLMKIDEGKMISGGAESFLSTLEKQLIPFVNNHYKTSADRGLSGHSLGGLFAGYCLLKKPYLFKRYGINSPSFWWNNNELARDESVFASQQTALTARVFFSVGGAEDPMMLASFNTFTNSIKSHNYQGLSMTVKVFDGETHLSVVAACSSGTLKALYGYAVK